MLKIATYGIYPTRQCPLDNRRPGYRPLNGPHISPYHHKGQGQFQFHKGVFPSTYLQGEFSDALKVEIVVSIASITKNTYINEWVDI